MITLIIWFILVSYSYRRGLRTYACQMLAPIFANKYGLLSSIEAQKNHMKSRRAMLAVLILAALFTPCSLVRADDLADGLAAYDAKSYAKAMQLLDPLAVDGNADAQFTVSLMYMFGEGTDVNMAKAMDWRRKAAAQGQPDALSSLAFIYLYGLQGVKADSAEASRWLTIAAGEGDAWAQSLLADLYSVGKGVKKDEKRAIDLYTAAARNPKDPDAAAQFKLGSMNETGVGLVQDYSSAKLWYERSAAAGYVDAMVGLGRLYENGNGVMQDFVLAHKYYNLAVAHSSYSDAPVVAASMLALASKMSRTQINEAQELAVAEYEKKNVIGSLMDADGKRAKAGEVVFQAFLGLSYEKGTEGTPQHYLRAIEWLSVAADRGNREAQYHLGMMFRDGLGRDRDVIQAYKWLNIAASEQCEPYCGMSELLEEQAKTRDAAKAARDALAQAMSPDDLAMGQEVSRKWQKAP